MKIWSYFNLFVLLVGVLIFSRGLVIGQKAKVYDAYRWLIIGKVPDVYDAYRWLVLGSVVLFWAFVLFGVQYFIMKG